ncbi:MAG: hybrid sensor histidine kinase/response regulator [Myxococcales bacterium]|nr:hybrid sensor histidine kinase/response regulator [Myxococcales bacterium]MCB9754930.1 hybrid sensor histidine kinase/response regulator [Myxococcales bacterium]
MSDASPPTVLLVDDTPENIGLLLRELELGGMRVLVALDGLEALEVATRAEPDVILLDVMMPRLDGYETCRRLKAMPRTRPIPVLFMTALTDTEAKLRGFAAGGVDYITKPFDREEVRVRVATHLELRRAQRVVAERGRLLEQRARDTEALARMVAHDLRNPLSTLAGGLATLEEQLAGPLEPDERGEVAGMVPWLRDVAGQMADAIDAVLLLLDVTRGPGELASVDSRYALQLALDRIDDRVLARGATIELAGGMPIITGRATWLSEVWFQLLDNAIKYGGEPLEVRVSWARDGERARFELRDNGPGLTPEQRARVFEEFTRFHQARARGNGLGLALVRRVIERLGGEVGVEASPGGGAAFWFSLPLAPSERA